MRFITDHKDRADGGLRWGVESICAVLASHGVGIAPSTYYDARDRGLSAREQRDERWKDIIFRHTACHVVSVLIPWKCGQDQQARRADAEFSAGSKVR